MFERARQEIRSLVDAKYRRAFRSLCNLPRIDYRVVVDAGANHGSFTEALLRLHQPQRVVMVEPLPMMAEKLRARYQGRAGFSVVAAALSDRDGEAEFNLNKWEDASSLLEVDARNDAWFGLDLKVRKRFKVPTVTLPRLLQDERIEQVDLLKLDLQGAERLVLTGAEPILSKMRVIYAEAFFEPLYQEAWLFSDLNRFLVERGFKLCGISHIVHAVNSGDLLQANVTFRQLAST